MSTTVSLGISVSCAAADTACESTATARMCIRILQVCGVRATGVSCAVESQPLHAAIKIGPVSVEPACGLGDVPRSHRQCMLDESPLVVIEHVTQSRAFGCVPIRR